MSVSKQEPYRPKSVDEAVEQAIQTIYTLEWVRDEPMTKSGARWFIKHHESGMKPQQIYEMCNHGDWLVCLFANLEIGESKKFWELVEDVFAVAADGISDLYPEYASNLKELADAIREEWPTYTDFLKEAYKLDG